MKKYNYKHNATWESSLLLASKHADALFNPGKQQAGDGVAT